MIDFFISRFIDIVDTILLACSLLVSTCLLIQEYYNNSLPLNETFHSKISII